MRLLFNALAAVDALLSDEHRVVHLLVSLPDSFSVLVTAVEASPEVPKMEVATERLLHEERKLSSGRSDGDAKAMSMKVDFWIPIKVVWCSYQLEEQKANISCTLNNRG